MLVARLSDDVRGVLVETEYVDKDYRSVFYHFYAKRADDYARNCVRIHFFRQGVVFDEREMALRLKDESEADEEANDLELSRRYLGFVTLRPTGARNIGRSVIHPDALRQATGSLVTADHKVHVLGHRLKAVGFPWMMQHVDISVCAHVACWSILRHYSEKYSKYAELLLHDITKLAQPFDPGGLIPSIGLAAENAERILYVAGTFPLVIDREVDGESFERQMLAYLESGFPIFAMMPDKTHAVAIIGIAWRADASDTGDCTNSVQDLRSKVDALIASDDNHLPYVRVGWNDALEPCDYAVKDIQSFIVALPDKVFCPASFVDKIALHVPQALPELAFPDAEDCVRRYYITTAAALRRDLRTHKRSFDPQLAAAIMQMPMSQFVWIVEFASSAQWDRDEVAVRLIVDATASEADNEPFWVAFDGGMAILWDQKRGLDDHPAILKMVEAAEPVRRIHSNLRSEKSGVTTLGITPA